ncbi:MAG: hypothetical protein HY021_00445 [Burkholderiales bacterium]|nr:hypothetical protein [Burkholderiales bacterium]
MQVDFVGYMSFALVVLMFIALFGVLAIVWRSESVATEKDGSTKTKKGRFSRRAIQFLSAALVVPVITLLSLNGLSSEVVGTLLGTFIGYVLSGIGETPKGDSN